MIINANGISYLVTGHAEGEMIMDGISAEEIKKTLENGELGYTRKGDEFYRYNINGREVGVVVIEGEERIRTVFVIS